MKKYVLLASSIGLARCANGSPPVHHGKELQQPTISTVLQSWQREAWPDNHQQDKFLPSELISIIQHYTLSEYELYAGGLSQVIDWSFPYSVNPRPFRARSADWKAKYPCPGRSNDEWLVARGDRVECITKVGQRFVDTNWLQEVGVVIKAMCYSRLRNTLCYVTWPDNGGGLNKLTARPMVKLPVISTNDSKDKRVVLTNDLQDDNNALAGIKKLYLSQDERFVLATNFDNNCLVVCDLTKNLHEQGRCWFKSDRLQFDAPSTQVTISDENRYIKGYVLQFEPTVQAHPTFSYDIFQIAPTAMVDRTYGLDLLTFMPRKQQLVLSYWSWAKFPRAQGAGKRRQGARADNNLVGNGKNVMAGHKKRHYEGKKHELIVLQVVDQHTATLKGRIQLAEKAGENDCDACPKSLEVADVLVGPQEGMMFFTARWETKVWLQDLQNLDTPMHLLTEAAPEAAEEALRLLMSATGRRVWMSCKPLGKSARVTLFDLK